MKLVLAVNPGADTLIVTFEGGAVGSITAASSGASSGLMSDSVFTSQIFPMRPVPV